MYLLSFFSYRESLKDEISYKIIELEKIDNLPINGKLETFDINYKIAVSLFIHTEHIIFGRVHRYLIDRLQNINDPVNNRKKISTRNICTATLQTIYSYTDWWQYIPMLGIWVYLGATETSSVYWANDDCYNDIPGSEDGGWGAGADNTNPGGTTYEDPDPDDGIDPKRLLDNPKFKCLYETFMGGNYSLFNTTIKPFKASEVQLTFLPMNDSSTPPPGCKGNVGCTELTKDGNVNIYLPDFDGKNGK